jgi:hypothetical protein
MKALAIGMALFWVLVLVTRRKYSIKGVTGILLFGFISWGLGSLVLAAIGAQP